MEEIKFNENVEMRYLGRNGSGNCKGLIVQHFEGSVIKKHPYVYLVPINSKGDPARCCIEIPKESIPEVTKALQNNLLDLVLDNIDMNQLPKLMGLDPDLDKEISARFKGED